MSDTNNYNIYTDKYGTKYWYLNGQRYTFSEWVKMVDIFMEEKCELVLYYG